jgi:NAD(P)-dependent dehydrogenase (short-subunit alcohol dehydrogenase family)
MSNIVITGSARGIGFGLARSFLDRGCKVMLSSLNQDSLNRALESLSQSHNAELFSGVVCDVRSHASLENLRDAALDFFDEKRIDIWVNNAGRGQPHCTVQDINPEMLETVIETNILGLVLGSQVAARQMIGQGGGLIVNMEGFGSSGARMKKLAIYGMTKYSVKYFTKCLATELKGTGVRAGALNPGMVATDFIRDPFKGKEKEFEQAKKIFNIIASMVEQVTPWMVNRMLYALKNKRTGFSWSFAGPLKMMGRFLIAPFRKREIF